MRQNIEFVHSLVKFIHDRLGVRAYVNMCSIEYFRQPRKSYVLTSDDVFDYVLNARYINKIMTIEEKHCLINILRHIKKRF